MTELNIKCLISGKDTDGRVAVFEEIVEPGGGPPRHTHRTQVEVFHVIVGTLRFEIAGETIDAGPGAAAVVPMGAVHAFQNTGSVPARIHFEMIPAGESEEAFSRLIEEGDQIEDVGAFFNQYDMDLIGPPLA
jgi:quercetin dioxygenase-like cupin family protein